MPLIPGAEPFAHDGGPVGALVVHGFTGSPVSMRPWAQALADAGLTVRLPRLPGHGSTWQDMALTTWEDWYAAVDTAFGELTERCADVFVCGLSMGGSLALRLAELRGDEVAWAGPGQPVGPQREQGPAGPAGPAARGQVGQGRGQRHRQAGAGRGLLRPGADAGAATS